MWLFFSYNGLFSALFYFTFDFLLPLAPSLQFHKTTAKRCTTDNMDEQDAGKTTSRQQQTGQAAQERQDDDAQRTGVTTTP